MWKHNCPVDGEMEVGDGEPCNWCGATQPANKASVALLLLLSGCVVAPISETPIPQAELTRCQALSEKAMQYRAAERGVIEASRATGVAYGITKIVPTVAVSTVLPYIAAGYAVTSAIGGQIEAQDRRDAIVRECLRDKGYKVY